MVESQRSLSDWNLALLFVVLGVLIGLTVLLVVVYHSMAGGFASGHCVNCTAVMPSG